MKKNCKYLIAALVLLIGLVLVACASIDSIFFEVGLVDKFFA